MTCLRKLLIFEYELHLQFKFRLLVSGLVMYGNVYLLGLSFDLLY